ncbi:Protein of unknown function [Lactobacillus delbrueckii subsp. lactis]|nr:Putative uncharacterized protein [Lactobacillus delbrueckii subsp. lactis]CDR82665.1 Protein of unknown function [Lactobacillus delbrueckii subsp. lactis]
MNRMQAHPPVHK